MANRWRVEKITEFHEAHINNPWDYPEGYWYVTDDPDGTSPDWTEFSARTLAGAIAGIYERQGA